MTKVAFIEDPAERTTAATDVLLALLALVAAVYLLWIGSTAPWKAGLWAAAFVLLTLAAALGAIAHGLVLSEAVRPKIWHLLYLVLGLTVALFMVGTIYDLWGIARARQLLPITLLFGVLFFGSTLIWSDNFFVFIIYQAVALLFAGAGYLWLALSGQLDGAWLMVAGIVVTMVAAGIQSSPAIAFRFIWDFDHNGAYHLVQTVALILLVLGLRGALLA